MKKLISNKKLKRLTLVIIVVIVGFITYLNFSTYAWFIDSYSISIDDTKKTFSVYDSNGELMKTSKEYKQVLAIDGDIIAVIDNDSYVKIINKDDNIIATFKDKYPDARFDVLTLLYSEPDIIRLHFTDKNDDLNIIYSYNRKTGETFVETKP